MEDRLFDVLQIGLPLIAVVLAVWRGGLARTAGIAVGLAWICSALIMPERFTSPLLLLFSIDLLLALWLTRLTYFRRPLWLVLAAASTWLLVLNHVVFAINLGVLDWAFHFISNLWSNGVLLCLAWGGLRRE